MDTRRALLVDAFTSEALTGNAAGVLPDADGLNEWQMRAVAAELSPTETAFLRSSSGDDSDAADGDFVGRFFTPDAEVNRSVPAAVAGYSFLYEDGRIDAGTHTLTTGGGDLTVDVEDSGRVWVAWSGPEIRESDLDHGRVADALGIDPATLVDIGQDLPLARAGGDRPVLLVPVNFLEHLGQADPDAAALADVCEFDGVGGIYAFTFDTLEMDSTVHGRLFESADGVREDPVTATAAGSCGAYLRRYGAFDTLPDELIFEQGDFVDRPGRVHVQVRDVVRVGGHAVTSLDGSLVVPDIQPDDIVEA